MKTCETCRWWANDYHQEAECRARSPIWSDKDYRHKRAFPITKREDWCGEHAPREGGPGDPPV